MIASSFLWGQAKTGALSKTGTKKGEGWAKTGALSKAGTKKGEGQTSLID